jgi:hypothetical protein
MIKERFTVPPFACKAMEGKQGSGLKKIEIQKPRFLK